MVIPQWKSALLGRFTAIQFENVIGYGDGTKKLMIGSIVFCTVYNLCHSRNNRSREHYSSVII